MDGAKILVVDDEPDITELIELYLVREGFQVYLADTGATALELVQDVRPDLIILDIQMQQMTGIEVCEHIRATSDVPILFISCMSDDTDIIHGLSVGGDDYMTKPFSPRQLVARVKAHLRRRMPAPPANAAEQPAVLSYGPLSINLEEHTIHLEGEPINLSVKEFDLLTHLARHPNKVFNLDHLYQAIWGADSIGDTRTLMVHISNLRKKIEADPANPSLIVTVRGVGYKFNAREG